MPNFELVPLEVAMMKSATTGKRGEVIKEYLGYIERLEEGKAGKLQVTEGERPGAVRRRLGAAAKLVGKNLVIKRVGEEIYFWVPPREVVKRGRRKAEQQTPC